MKSFNTVNYLKGSTDRLNSYVSKLKHGATFKYVKGFTQSEKTLLNICHFRQNNGEFLKLRNDELVAFGLNPTEKNGMIVAADVAITTGKLTIVPVEEF